MLSGYCSGSTAVVDADGRVRGWAEPTRDRDLPWRAVPNPAYLAALPGEVRLGLDDASPRFPSHREARRFLLEQLPAVTASGPGDDRDE
jgi:hypothetical protein